MCFGVAFFLVYSGYINVRTAIQSPKEIILKRDKNFPSQFDSQPDSKFSPFITVAANPSVKDIFFKSTVLNLETLLNIKLAASKPLDVTAVTPTGRVYAWNKAEGLKKFPKTELPCTAYPALYDLNLDGIPDIVIQASDSRLYIVDGKSGEILYKSDILGQQAYSSPVVCSPKKGALADIFTCTQNGLVNFISKPLNNPKVVSEKIDGNVFASPVLTCKRNKAELNILSVTGKFYTYDAVSFKLIDKLDIRELTGINNLNISATPAIGDINGDGKDDIIVISNEEYVIAIDKSGKKLIWKPLTLEEKPFSGFTGLYPSCVLSDIDGDKILDIVALSSKGKLYGIKGTTGDVLLQFDSGAQVNMSGSPALADINKDGTNEIIFGTEKGELYILNFSNAQKDNMQLYYGKLFNKPITNTPVVLDADADGYIDIIVSALDGSAALMKSNVPTFSGYVYWPTFQGSQDHPGHRSNGLKTIFILNIAVIISGIFYIIAFGVSVLFRKSKRRISWIG
ncbi:MAG: FG-GAP-like repeat-containing protein [Elusimicrobiota bacterium]